MMAYHKDHVQEKSGFLPGQKVRCLYNQDEIYEDELEYSVGEILTIVGASLDTAWCRARNGSGKEGLILENSVVKHDAAIEPSTEIKVMQHHLTRGDIVQCRYEFDSTKKGQLSFSKGELLVIRELMDEWKPGAMLECIWENDAQNHNELSFSKWEILTLVKLKNEEWCFASNKAGREGFIPRNRVLIFKDPCWSPGQKVKCLYTFAGPNADDLHFTKGEILTIVKATIAINRYMAKNEAGIIGVIPTRYVETLQAYDDLETLPWFHGNINRKTSEELLLPRVVGCFLVRKSESFPGDYTLSVCSGNCVFHYRIRSLASGFTHNEKTYFSTLQELIEHFNKIADGLYTRLVEPCLKPYSGSPEKPGALPPEILSMDENSQKLYREALAAGKERVYNIRVMIVGHQGVGKTALTKRLLGEKVEEETREPTEGIEIHANCCQIDHETKEWKKRKTDENVTDSERIAGIIIKHVNEKQNASTINTEGPCTMDAAKVNIQDDTIVANSEICVPRRPNTNKLIDSTSDRKIHVSVINIGPNNSHGSTDSANKKSSILSSPTVSDVMNLKPVNNTAEEVIKFVEDARSVTLSNNTMSDVTMLDFAGEFMFYTTHQAFMSWRTLYLLVTDIRMSLMDTIQDDACVLDLNGDKTSCIQDYVLYWMNSIHSLKNVSRKYDREQNPDDSKSATVILVATHTDKIPKNDVQKKKQVYFDAIRKVLKDRPLRFHLIEEDFAITNICSDPTVDALKSKLFETAQRQNYWGEEVPARWLPLQKALMELKRKGVQIIDYSEVEKLNQSRLVKIESSDELQLFLKFEHDIGNIVYFSTKKLCLNVVLNPVWLIDGLKILMTSDEIIKRHPELSAEWYEFRSTGRVTKRLLDSLWSHHPQFHQNQRHLLGLMEKLNIIARPHRKENAEHEDEFYWVPCMVHKTAPEVVRTLGERKNVTKTSTLCFESKTKFIHIGVFHRLLASCLSEWSLAKEGNGYLLFSGLCVFELDNNCHHVMISMNDYVIQATVIRFSNSGEYPEISLCIVARDYLQTSLSDIASYLCPNSEFETCIKCNQSTPQSNEGLHKISSLHENKEIRCSCHRLNHVIESKEILRFWEKTDRPIPIDVQTAERFMRLYSLLVDVGTKVLRRVLHYYTVSPNCSLDQYLKNYTHAILDLKKKRVLNQSQIDIIFPQAGDTDITKYDITLLSALLNNIVPSLGQNEKQSVITLRNNRNNLMHVESTKMNINDYQTMWMSVTTNLTDLSKICRDTAFEEEVKKEIQDIQKSGSSDILSKLDSFDKDLEEVKETIKNMLKLKL